MSIKLKISSPYRPVYAGNPIWISGVALDGDTQESATGEIFSYAIEWEDTDGERHEVYNGTITTSLTGTWAIQVSDLIEEYMPDVVSAYPDLWISTPIIKDFEISFTGDNIQGAYGAQISVMPGRLPNSLLRELALKDQSIFTYKWFNHLGNFSSLTGNRVIKLYESEVLPVMVIGCGERILATGENGRKYWDTDNMRAYMLNLAELATEIGNHIQFSYSEDESTAFTIIIMQDPETVSPTLFEYRNTFGIMERILTTGAIEHQLSFSSDSKSTEFESLTNTLIPIVADKEYSFDRTINTGYLTPDRIDKAIALLTSPEVYIIDGCKRERVILSSGDKLKMPAREPQALSLSINSISVDSGHVGEMDKVSVHSVEFNKFYN